MTKSRTKPAEIRIEELVDAALTLFLDKGFHATSVAEIVGVAGVAKGTFYLYFQTKEDVLVALQKRFLDGFIEKIETALFTTAGRPWQERLDEWMKACVLFYLENVELHDLVFHQFAWSRNEFQQPNPIVDRLSELLEAGRAAGEFDVENTRLTAVMLFSAMHGAVDAVFAEGEPFARDILFKSVARLCRQSVIAIAS